MYLPLFVHRGSVSVFIFGMHYFAIIFSRKRELVALLLLSFRCLVAVNVLWLFLTVSLVGLQFVIVIFHLLTYLFNRRRAWY